jgi:hypothetical protein
MVQIQRLALGQDIRGGFSKTSFFIRISKSAEYKNFEKNLVE